MVNWAVSSGCLQYYSFKTLLKLCHGRSPNRRKIQVPLLNTTRGLVRSEAVQEDSMGWEARKSVSLGGEC